jgi:hypothetical protein
LAENGSRSVEFTNGVRVDIDVKAVEMVDEKGT